MTLADRTVLPAHHAGCFGCGEAEGGLRMRFAAGDGDAVTGTFTVCAHHQGAPGIAHGGVLAAAFDEALGFLAVHHREPAVTAELTTRFRRPVPVGATLHLLARIDSRDGRKIRCSSEARLHDHDGPVAAAAKALFMTVPLTHFTEHGTA